MSFLFTIPVLIVQTVHGIVHGIYVYYVHVHIVTFTYLPVICLVACVMIWYILSMSDYITLWYYVSYILNCCI
jgi:flagellar biosynthesis protein FliQ